MCAGVYTEAAGIPSLFIRQSLEGVVSQHGSFVGRKVLG